jgi:hypothetical protein
MRTIITLLICSLTLFNFIEAKAQKKIPLKLAVFAPIYLDSAFEGAVYKLGNSNLPKTILPGLDFYNGIMLAIDSLNAENQFLEVQIYDSKSLEEPLELQLLKPALQSVSLIIASFNNRNDTKVLADFALSKNIPLLSMTYPNDGGITKNPYFALVNPTLRTHIESIYKYLQRSYPTETITLFKRKGSTEDMIAGILYELNKKTPALSLKLKTVELEDAFLPEHVFSQLDSTKQNLVLCGSLNEQFGISFLKNISSNKNYKTLTIGMPTWDAIKELPKEADIIYTTPYNYNRADKIGQQINNSFRNKYAGRPSDMAYKGFEAMYHFGKLLLKYEVGLVNHLSDKDFKLFNEFDFQPVRIVKDGKGTDYLENKKLYFVRKTDGQIKSVN